MDTGNDPVRIRPANERVIIFPDASTDSIIENMTIGARVPRDANFTNITVDNTITVDRGGAALQAVGTFTASSNPTNAKATQTLTLTGLPSNTQTCTIGSTVYRFVNSLAQAYDVLIDQAVAAVGLLTLTGQPSNTQTVTIGSKTYTFLTVLVDSDGNILIGADTAATCTNLIAAVNAAAGAGTTYGTGTAANSDVAASAGTGTTVVMTAKVAGTAGNSLATTETMTNASFGAVTLTGGEAASTTDTIDNFVAAITGGAGSGTVYHASTVTHTTVTAVRSSSTLVATAISRGTGGNSIATTETMSNASWGNTTLLGGTTETVTIGSKVYNLQGALTNVANNVLIGATASDTLDNIIAAVNGAAGSGTTYAAATVAHTLVTAAAGAGDTIVVTAITAGPAGNAIVTTETCAACSWGDVTLVNGSNYPAYLALSSSDGTLYYLFVEDDGTVKVASAVPDENGDGNVVGAQS